MDNLIPVLAVLAGIIGIFGSVLPALPGPPLSWIGMLLLYFRGGTNSSGETMSLTILMVMLGVTIIVSIIDYIVPIYFTKLTGGSKAAGWGAIIGLLVGVFLIPPVGMILGSFLGARDTGEALKSAAGSLVGFFVGTGLKLIACAVMMYYIVVYI